MTKSSSSDFFSFCNQSTTSLHAVNETKNHLEKEGFQRYTLNDTLKHSSRYYYVEDGFLIAFTTPSGPVEEMKLIASHTDSPCLKLKPQTEKIGAYTFVSVEPYGAPILSEWIGQKLMLSGRIYSKAKNGHVTSKLVSIPKTPFLIPNAPIHLQKSSNDAFDKQKALKVLFSFHDTSPSLHKWLENACDVENILSFDLFLSPTTSAAFIGSDQKLIASPRLDNLSSAWSCINAQCQTVPSKNGLQIAAFFDHEEIGSQSLHGAQSSNLKTVLEGIFKELQAKSFASVIKRSQALSFDVAHAIHPGYAHLFDTPNTPQFGKGLVIKKCANRKYSNHATLEAFVINMLQNHKLPYQHYARNNNHAGGSTLGRHLESNLAIATLDVGIPLLSMHSMNEVIDLQDLNTMTKAALGFLNMSENITHCKEEIN